MVASAALGIEELQQFPERFAVRGVVQERTFTTHVNQAFVPELVQMVGKSRIGDIEFFLNLSNHHALGMGRKEQLHDSKPGLCTHGREHVCVLGYLLGSLLGRGTRHISIIAEI